MISFELQDIDTAIPLSIYTLNKADMKNKDIYWLHYFCVFIALRYSRGSVSNWDGFDREKHDMEISNDLEDNAKGNKFGFKRINNDN